MTTYGEMLEQTIKQIEAQIEHAIYTGEKFKQAQLEKQLDDLKKALNKNEPPGACI